ncbi:hypothetical protein ACJ73_10241, partial [Blastomyces percursus]
PTSGNTGYTPGTTPGTHHRALHRVPQNNLHTLQEPITQERPRQRDRVEKSGVTPPRVS